MVYKSNIPGTLTVKLGAEVDTDTYEVSATFNEVARYMAISDGQVYLSIGGISYPVTDAPASHVLTFGSILLTYTNDDDHVAVISAA